MPAVTIVPAEPETFMPIARTTKNRVMKVEIAGKMPPRIPFGGLAPAEWPSQTRPGIRAGC